MRTLLEEVVHSVMDPALNKKWFGSPELPFRRYLGCYQEEFELGVVVGYAYRSDVTILVRLFSQPGHETELTAFIQGLAKEKLSGMKETEGFFGIAMFAEEQRIRANWRYAEMTLTEEQLDVREDEFKIPLESAFQNLSVAVSTGVGFGSAFPEVTERLWEIEHNAPVNLEDVKRLRAAGLDIPAELEPPVTLPDREGELRRSVQQFVLRYRPELRAEFDK